jgi:hypothetical protein
MQNCYVIPEDAPELIRGKTLKIVELDGGKYFTKITPFSTQLKQEEVDYVGSFLKRIVGEDIRELPYRTYGPLKIGEEDLTIVDYFNAGMIDVEGFTRVNRNIESYLRVLLKDTLDFDVEGECKWTNKDDAYTCEFKKINE